MDEKKVQQGCVIGCFGLIVLVAILTVVLVSCSVDGEEEDKAFDFTVDEYETTLRKTVGDSADGTFIKMKAKEEVEENYYEIPLTNNIVAYVSLNENGEVIETEMDASGSAFLVTNKEVMIAFQSLVKSTDPTLSVTQLYTLFDKLGINGSGSMLDSSASYSLNGISYHYIGSVEHDRLMLFAKPE